MSRCQLEEKKLGAGRNGGANIKAASSTPAQSSNRRSDSGVQTTSVNANKNYGHSRAVSGPGPHMSGNSTTGSRGISAAQNGCQPLGATNELAPIAQGCEKVLREGVEVGKPTKNSRTFSSPHRKRRDRQTEHVDEECSYSDDMKELLKTTGGENVQGYPNGSKRFDWVKTLRIGGAVSVRENQACSDFASQVQGKTSSSPHQKLRESDELECVARDMKIPTSVSKSVQTGGASAEDTSAKTSGVILEDRHDSESRLKRRPDNSSSIENRPGKSGKKTLFPEEMGGLDSRINYHLLKAGLRRAPSLWKTGPVRNALRVKKKTFGSRSPRKDGGKRLRTRTLFDLNLKAYSAKVAPHEAKLGDQAQPRTRECQEGVDVQWQSEVADCEAEYETFVENTDVGLHDSDEDTSNVKREVLTSEEEEQKRSSPSSVSTLEAKAKLSEAPVLSLMKTPQTPKKTFIRCIDLVVATKKKNQLSKINGRKPSGVRYSYRRIDCSKSPGTNSYGLHKDCQIKPQINEGELECNSKDG